MDPLGRRGGRIRMRGRGVARLSAVVLVAVGLPAAAGARPPAEDWRIEPFEWRGSLGAGRTLAVRNPYGDVRARRTEGASVTVYAALQRHADDPRQWRVAIAEAGDGLTVEVALAGGAVPAGAAADWGLRRVDMTVYVPADAKLRVETTAGLIEAKRLAGDVEARSAGGEIVITTTGSVDARSEGGRIRYSFLDPGWVGSARLVTRAGDVVVTLPRGADVELAVRTGGEVSADGLPAAEAGSARRASRHELDAVLGAGGNRVAIESESGDVAVRRSPR